MKEIPTFYWRYSLAGTHKQHTGFNTHIYFLKERAYILAKWDCAQEKTPGLMFLMSNG